VTQQKVGITPREENIPLTINANYFVGFDFTRNWQIRVVKDFDKTFWLGVSVENPATLEAPGIPETVNGLVVNVVNTGTGGFLNGVNVTPDQAPDIIEKGCVRSRLGSLRGVRAAAVFYRQHLLRDRGADRLRRRNDQPQDLLRQRCGRFGPAAGYSEISRSAGGRDIRPRHRSLRTGAIAM
jgi:hypothetical protein